MLWHLEQSLVYNDIPILSAFGICRQFLLTSTLTIPPATTNLRKQKEQNCRGKENAPSTCRWNQPLYWFTFGHFLFLLLALSSFRQQKHKERSKTKQRACIDNYSKDMLIRTFAPYMPPAKVHIVGTEHTPPRMTKNQSMCLQSIMST